MPPEGNGVRFENQGDEFGRPPQRAGTFDLTGKLVEWGLVKSNQEAQYVLLAVAVVLLLIAGYFIFHSGSGTVPPPPPVS
jgi:hypothetical protein